ncbi:hypothetical protein KBB05_00350 [Patescibacteria group bacterium]|nr:hypothetical protein [Patescibacteria group bacterium]
MIDIQYNIYLLDNYGENNRITDQKIINELFNNIKNKVFKTGMGKQEIAVLLQPMLNFIQIELNMRNDISPATISIEAYYEAKICDILLIHGIIDKHL